MHLPIGPKRLRGLVLAFVVASLLWPQMSRAQPGASGPAAAPPLTAAQQQRLKERDRYAAETAKLRGEGKLAEAVAAAEKMLAIEREVLGELHEDVVGSLVQLAELHAGREDFAAARAARQGVLAICMKLYGGKDWRAADAQWALEDLGRFERLDPVRRQRLRLAASLYDLGWSFTLGGPARPYKRHRAAGRVRPRHRPPRPLPAGPADRRTPAG
jgi:hypothetical protein